MSASKKKSIKASDFDKAFEEGDVTEYLDLKKAKVRRPVHRINIDIPEEILEKVNQEASRIGVTRTSLLKMWIVENVDRLAS